MLGGTDGAADRPTETFGSVPGADWTGQFMDAAERRIAITDPEGNTGSGSRI